MKKQQVGEELAVEDFCLRYFITEKEISYEGEEVNVYGVEILKKTLTQIEEAHIEDVTADETKIFEIVNKVRENMVTPVHLYDVMENFL